MERLPFGPDHAYSAIEASIHVARYAAAASLCQGKTVLDIACGEGYGAYCLAEKWGAAKVVGVDVSRVAISKARTYFGSEKIEFIECAATDIESLFKAGTFDLVISLETIEHLDRPSEFLKAIKRAAKEDASFLISCPNDHHYYPTAGEGNRFHFRKYKSDEFYSMVCEVLGEPSARYLGAPIAGFANIPDTHALLAPGKNSVDLRRVEAIEGGLQFLPDEIALSADNCSYFLGVWGDRGLPRLTSAFHAPPMPRPNSDLYERESPAGAEVRSLQQKLSDLEAKLRSEQLAKKAAAQELELLQSSFGDYSARMAAVPWRVVAIYRRVRRLLPDFAVEWAATLFDKVKLLRR